MASLPMPERVGRYEILLPIASGGMATVYLARVRGSRGFERDVALKLTHAYLRESKEFVFDLAEEAKLAGRVKHPNVVAILDVGEDPCGLFLVMEYVEGDTLSGLRYRSKTEPVPRRVAMRVLVDALAGLHAAHEMCDEDGTSLRLVHRDFSPQNILVGVDGVSRLADFGVAKAANALEHTRTGLVKGKIGYMSPEQARAQSVDRRSDVWAAGVIAWEQLTNRRLYPGNDLGLVFRIATEAPPRVRTLDPTISPEVEEVVARALTLDREERWPTAAAFARELVRAHRGDLAEVDEVAAFVTAISGPRLAERRAAAAKIVELRRTMGAVVQTATIPDGGSTPSGVPSAMPPTETESVSTEVSPNRPAPTGATQSVLVSVPEWSAGRPAKGWLRRRWYVPLAAAASFVVVAAMVSSLSHSPTGARSTAAPDWAGVAPAHASEESPRSADKGAPAPTERVDAPAPAAPTTAWSQSAAPPTVTSSARPRDARTPGARAAPRPPARPSPQPARPKRADAPALADDPYN